MTKSQVEHFTEREILKGKSRQEVFNEVVTVSDISIHSAADIIRKVPTLEGRKKYRSTNFVLLGMIGILLLFHLVNFFLAVEHKTNLSVGQIIVPGLLLWGVYNFKRNAHLISGILLSVMALISLGQIIFYFDWVYIAILSFSAYGIAVSFFLDSKLSGDYILDKELQKTNPGQRVDSVTFTD
ncbi:MAG: hypothetical protein K0S32_3347 [Bacteroidetes bacterium]|jgi:hypothetical protein|nr:hypothetical protein [Bacteroidota bacterium]